MTDGNKKPSLNRWLGAANHHLGGGHRQVRWLTPPELVEALGEFDLDPCGAPGHVLAARTYLLENGEDGLRDPWEGRVWLNPPYGKDAAPFLSRLAEHGQGIALIFARTETGWFHEQVWEKASGILFLKGRVTFLDADKVPAKANSGAPSCLVAYGEEDAEILRQLPLPGQYVHLED
jgi:hypothetical protein